MSKQERAIVTASEIAADVVRTGNLVWKLSDAECQAIGETLAPILDARMAAREAEVREELIVIARAHAFAAAKETMDEEREACAQIVESWGGGAWGPGAAEASHPQSWARTRATISRIIRARKTEGSGAAGPPGCKTGSDGAAPSAVRYCATPRCEVLYGGDCPGHAEAPSPEPAPAVEEAGALADEAVWVWDILRDDALWEDNTTAVVKALHDLSSLEEYHDEEECAEGWLPDIVPSRLGALMQAARAIAARLRSREALVEALLVAAEKALPYIAHIDGCLYERWEVYGSGRGPETCKCPEFAALRTAIDALRREGT